MQLQARHQIFVFVVRVISFPSWHSVLMANSGLQARSKKFLPLCKYFFKKLLPDGQRSFSLSPKCPGSRKISGES